MTQNCAVFIRGLFKSTIQMPSADTTTGSATRTITPVPRWNIMTGLNVVMLVFQLGSVAIACIPQQQVKWPWHLLLVVSTLHHCILSCILIWHQCRIGGYDDQCMYDAQVHNIFSYSCCTRNMLLYISIKYTNIFKSLLDCPRLPHLFTTFL